MFPIKYRLAILSVDKIVT